MTPSPFVSPFTYITLQGSTVSGPLPYLEPGNLPLRIGAPVILKAIGGDAAIGGLGR